MRSPTADLPRVIPLPREFYLPSASEVGPKLLGHFLLRQTADGWTGGPIVETEAYIKNDPACHAFRGETQRNKVMWGPPGHAYVYFIYGMYNCVNAVCRPAGDAEAVLIRAVEPHYGLAWMRPRRPRIVDHHLTSGPGKLCVAMEIDRTLNGVALYQSDSPLIIAANPRQAEYLESLGGVGVSSRIGITQAADWPLRFYARKSKSLSRPERGLRP